MNTNFSKSKFNPEANRTSTGASELIPWPVAVIDIGATSLRMQISEIHLDGSIRKLESFTQAISIGKDSFINGRINSSTIEDCVHVLRIYRMKLNEYEIFDNRQLRVIATSAVKEAQNRLAFIDRIYVATGFEVEPLDEAELHRITFVGALPLIEAQPSTFNKATAICEVSGGTTEILFFKSKEVLFSQSYRQGSLRIQKILQVLSGPIVSSRSVMEGQFSRMIGQIKQEAGKQDLKNMVAIGGDIRFAARQIAPANANSSPIQIELADLTILTDQILTESTERLVVKYHMSLPEAETLGPALMAYEMLAKAIGVEQILVADFNLRDGIVEEMAQGGKWSYSVEQQTIQSAVQIGRKFKFDEQHAVHVAELASMIFDQLSELHQLNQRYKVILLMASVLHEIGMFISTRSYHKHSLYLIRNSEFFGISAKDIELCGQVARYHRRATPQPNHEGYSKLDRNERVSVTKLAAMLRIGKALDSSRDQRITRFTCQHLANSMTIRIEGLVDITLEEIEMQKAGQLFSEIFGATVNLELAGESR